MHESFVWGLVCVLAGGIGAQWLAWRFRLPAIVLLFTWGLILGPGFGIIHPSENIGPFFRQLVSLAVAIIVFEGGLALDFREWHAASSGVLRLTIVALPLNWVLGTLAAHYVGNFSWGVAFLFGAITVVTGPTVVLPLLRHFKLENRVAAFLRWEAILNDPVGSILASLVMQVLLIHGGRSASFMLTTHILPYLLLGGCVSIVLGILPAFLIRFLFTRDLMPEVLKIPLLLGLALCVYAICSLFMEGTGLVAVTVFGMTLANLHVRGLDDLKRVKESLVVLIVSVLFIVLTADLNRTVLYSLSLPILLLTIAVMFGVRPVAIFFSTMRSGLSWQERTLLGWIAPRGIVAAAVAGVAGIKLREVGYPNAELITPAVFALIAATMVLHGFSLQPLAKLLGLAKPDQPALAIVGASEWSSNLALTLHKIGVPVLLCDSYSIALACAEEEGVPVLRAEILSVYGTEQLEETPVDYLISVTPDSIYNGLVCAHFAPHLGRERVFQVSPGTSRLDLYRGLSRDARGKLLGEPSWNFTSIEALYGQGWRFEALEATEEALASIKQQTSEQMLFLVIRQKTDLWINSVESLSPPDPMIGDLLIVFSDPAFVPTPPMPELEEKEETEI
ncbi:cation:proton antiporter [Entomobacter blattae]|uniref:K(+)/H(+) antiporter NhaP2 n=1 Tax=Entomobacter blattae TaxID=2762277 RepID=A0A7H1NSD1_9PROT|nr:sodium:proton antiporter [Entomobacter blattae]QNT78691.1 K(+)/H(+) antiporter NhaP2 [Entomobacter blattae]